MKKLKTTFVAFVMMFVLVFGTTFANAGIIIARDGGTCNSTAATTAGGKLNTGIIIAATGIIIAFTGIIIAFNDTQTASQPCGAKQVDSESATMTGIIIA